MIETSGQVRCRHCHRPLTDPETRRAGSGEDCARQHGEWVPFVHIRRRGPTPEDPALFDLENPCPTP